MSFIYKNPTSSVNVSTPISVSREDTFGTNFSVLQVGGYMEVYNLADLDFTIPSGDTGVIEFSGNTIPIRYSKRTLPFLPDVITLNSDNISSGRRKLGMLVYVHETQKTYQFTIPNYETLWDAASGSTSEGTYSTTVTTSTTGGTAFIDAWLDSSIEGVSGVTRDNARWKIFYGTDITVTGGTFDSNTGTATFTNTTGGTFNITGFTSGDVSISAITYNSEWGITKDSTDASSGTTQLPFITGGTYAGSNITLKIAYGLESDINISAPENTDTYVTGGTYNNSTGTLTLSRNDDGGIEITGFTTGTTEDTYVTGVTYSQINKELTLGLNDGVSFNATGFAPTITGGTYSNGEISLENNDGTSTQIGGLEILTHIGTTTASTVSVSGTTIDVVDSTKYEGAFFDYVINDGTNYRAGTVQAVWDGTNISYNDFSTVDIGTTTNFVWEVVMSVGEALLKANIAGGTWNIRIIKHII